MFYSSSSYFPGASHWRDQPHLPITCDILKVAASAKYRKGSLPQLGLGESIHCKQQLLHFTIEANCIPSNISLWHSRYSTVAAAIALFRWKPTIQSAAFAFSIPADQGAVAVQSSLFFYLPLPLLFLLSYLCYSFVLPFSFFAHL